MKFPASIVNTDMGEKNLAPKCYQHSEASRADTTNISSIQIHTHFNHERANSALLLYCILLNMSRKYFESLGLTYKADVVYTDEDLSNIKTIDGVDTIQSLTTLKQGMESMLETVQKMIVLLIVVSAILGFVIIYNLGILSFTEKQYQFATLKVLGF